jgi:membrane fusion protein, heavy metal efflux system
MIRRAVRVPCLNGSGNESGGAGPTCWASAMNFRDAALRPGCPPLAYARGSVRTVLALCTAVAFSVLSGCSSSEAGLKSNDAPATTVESAPDLNVITVDQPERFALATASSRRESEQLMANGVVAPDVSRNVPVNVLSSGRVVELRVRLGDTVQQGQLLLTMTSADLSQAIADYRKFQTGEALAKTQLDRVQLLLSHGAVAQKEVEIAQDTYTKARVDTQTAAERIRLLGGDLDRLSSSIEVRAPVSGTIVEQNVTAAAGVKSLDNSPNLFTIADLSRVWVVADVYENNLAQVHTGDRARIELNAYPGRFLEGQITNISALLDPNTRAAKVRIELANENELMRPNMFATVHFVSQGAISRTVIPAGAVLRLQDRDWVFVKMNGRQFRRTEVQAGPANADGTQQILSGVRAGEQVAANALEFDREEQNRD